MGVCVLELYNIVRLHAKNYLNSPTALVSRSPTARMTSRGGATGYGLFFSHKFWAESKAEMELRVCLREPEDMWQVV